MEGLSDRRFIVTRSLIALNVLVFAAMVAMGVSPVSPTGSDALRFGANFGALTTTGQWWRLLSSTFVHFGVPHLGLNMWALWFLGRVTERLFGHGRFLLLYVGAGLGGSMASLIWHPYVISAGASGAVFGLLAALGAFVYLGNVDLPESDARVLLSRIGLLIGLNLLIGLAIPGIDNAGHLGGLVTGAVLGAAASRRAFFLPAVASVLLLFVSLTPFATSRAQADPQVAMAQAWLALEDRDVETAIPLVEQTVKERPDELEALVVLGGLYMESQQYDKAIPVARRAIELDPQSHRAQATLAQALFFTDSYDEAVEELGIAIQLRPEDLQSRALLSRAYQETGQPTEAVEALAEALRWAEESPFLWNEMGMARFRAGELELAIEALERSVELDPEPSEGYNRLALVLARAGRTREALTAIETALEKDPEAPHILDSLGTVRYYREEYRESVEAYRRAIELDPNNAVYYYNVSLALLRLGDEATAAEELDRALALDPGLEHDPEGHPLI